MKKLMKKSVAVTMTALMLSVAVVGCGGSPKAEGTTAGAEVTTTAPETTTAAPLTEAEYKEQITTIYSSITQISTEAMAGVDATDQDKVIEATKKMIEDVKPLYEQMGALTAPDSLKDQQTKISEGAIASLEMLNLSLEMIELGTNPDLKPEEVEAKTVELTEKMAGMQTIGADMTAALAEVMQ